MITISVENVDQGDLFINITDLNQARSPVIVDRKRINARDSLLVDVQEDGHGSGKITWTALRTDHPGKTAQRTVTVGAGETVEVTTFFRSPHLQYGPSAGLAAGADNLLPPELCSIRYLPETVLLSHATLRGWANPLMHETVG